MKKFLLKKFKWLLKRKRFVLVKEMLYLERKRHIDGWDFVRQSTLELCAFEIERKKLAGSIAEVGVYKGEFAALMNQYFAERKLYLFDTFEGFDKKDVAIELSHGYSAGNQNFSDTSSNEVLKKMKYPDNCVIKKGYFPQTAVGVLDNFVFVSLDADLYQPLYEGLSFFYPKLSVGGYIIVHDFNNFEYAGARQAVVQFCKEEKIGYFPLSDVCGSVVITK